MLVVKNSPANARNIRDVHSIPGLQRSLEGGTLSESSLEYSEWGFRASKRKTWQEVSILSIWGLHYEETIWTANRILSQSGTHNHNNGTGYFSRKTHSHHFCSDKVFNMHLSYTELPLELGGTEPTSESHCGLLPGWEKVKTDILRWLSEWLGLFQAAFL